MSGGDLVILAIWVICLGISLAVSVVTGWRRPRLPDAARPETSGTGPGMVDAGSGAPLTGEAAGEAAGPVPGPAANTPEAPAEELRPPAA